MSDDRVGRVLGSEHTTTAEFRVVLEEDEYLQLDDLIVVRTEVPKVGEVRTYGVITEAEAVYEGAQYESDTHRIAELGIMPAAKVRTARVAVTRVDPEVWVSADPGEEVARATGEERRKALYADEMERPLPIGLGRDGAPVHVDLDFFDGRKGGHMSISGISGVATKTSFALFFLRMLTSTPEVVGSGAANLRVLVFNVKGEDLLWLDRPNASFGAHEGAREGWTALGVDPAPFPSVRFWAPPRRQSGDVVVPDTGGRFEGVEVFSWTPRAFIDQDLLEFCFTDASDAKNQIPFIRERVQLQLKRWAVGVDGMPGAVALRDPAQAPDGHAWSRDDRIPAAQAGVVIDRSPVARPGARGPSRARRRLGGRRRLDGAGDARDGRGLPPPPPRGVGAARASRSSGRRPKDRSRCGQRHRRRDPIAARTSPALRRRRAPARDVQGEGGHRAAAAAVGDRPRRAQQVRPARGTGPLKDMLIDIAQRGRSLGVLLVGAQQTASRVAPEVLENAAIRVTGRLDSAEAERAEYGWMLPSTRARARLLKPGTMVVSQPAIPVPLVVTFPFPPWATRKEEVADAGDDPFAGLT